MTNLAALYCDIGRHANAEPRFQRALAIAERNLGTESRLTGEILAQYALLMRETGRKTEAKTMEGRAQAIQRRHAALGRHTINVRDLATKAR
jgi:hypothetical protein